MTENGNVAIKERYYNSRKRKNLLLNWEGFQNPIPLEIRDAEKLKLFFETFGEVFVPYAGTQQHTSHSLLHLLLLLGKMHTQGAVTQRIGEHIFGGQVEVVNSYDPVFYIAEERAAPTAQQQAIFRDFVSNEVNFVDCSGAEIDVLQFCLYLFNDIMACGNAWVEIVQTVTRGVKNIFFHVHKVEDCLYLLTEKYQQRYVGVSAEWTTDYLHRFDPDVLPLYPAFKNETGGVSRSMVHIKTGNQYWYGRPRNMGALIYNYRQLQDAVFMTKLSRNNFTGQTIIEIEAEKAQGNSFTEMEQESIDAGFNSLADQIEANFTQKSDDPLTIFLMQRPAGADPMATAQINPTMNAELSRITNEQARTFIIEQNGWSQRLLVGDVGNGFDSNVFLDEIETKRAMLSYYDRLIGNVLNNVLLGNAMKFYEYNDLMNYSLSFKTPYFGLLEKKQQNVQQPDNGVGGDSESTVE